MTERIGFVGVGDMGGPMARRLLGAGFPLVVHDISEAALEQMLAAGAERAADAEEVASKAETVMICLNSLDAIRDVAAAAARGSRIRTFIDLSTTGPTFARELRDLFADTPVTMLDCPVSGAMKGAEEGTLALMISGPEPAFQSVRPMLEAIGKNLFYLGETPGGGQMMKLVNNYLSSMASVGTSEALVLGVKAGLDAKTMLDVINVSTGRNNASSVKMPEGVLKRRFHTGGRMTITSKDISLCLAEAERLGVPMRIGAVTKALFDRAIEEGHAAERSSAVIKVIEADAGVIVGKEE